MMMMMMKQNGPHVGFRILTTIGRYHVEKIGHTYSGL